MRFRTVRYFWNCRWEMGISAAGFELHDLGANNGKQLNRIFRYAQLCLCFCGGTMLENAWGMDRFAALSMIESGDDDFAQGKHAEVSRFQIRSEVWLQTTNLPIEQATNLAVALAVAEAVAEKRCHEFETKHGRAPTDFEFYILWNSPKQVDDPRRTVRARARRFVNLVERTG